MGREEKGNARVSVTEIDEQALLTEHEKVPRIDVTRTKNGYAHRHRPLALKAFSIAVDIVLASSPLLFIGIACAAIAYDGKLQEPSLTPATGMKGLLVTDGGNTVIIVAAVAVSILPIIFAAIAGRFLKSYAMYRAEYGASMGMLEQIYGSQSLSNAVQLTYALRGSGVVGLGVVVLWLLSPLGGQATQRVLSTKSIRSSSTGTVYYTNTSAINRAYTEGSKERVDNIYAILSAVLLTDSIMTTNDIWGNVKIPYLEALNFTNQTKFVQAVPSRTPYSSMVGLLVNNLTNGTASHFTTKTSYLALTCEEPRLWDFTGLCQDYWDGATAPDPSKLQPYYDFLTWANLLRNLPNGSISTTTNDPDWFMSKNDFWSSWRFNVGVQMNGSSDYGGVSVPTYANPPSFVYSAQVPGGCLITAYKCASKVMWVESEIVCQADELCRVRSMKNSTRPQEDKTDAILEQRNDIDLPGSSLKEMLGTLNNYSSFGANHSTHPVEWYVSGSHYLFPTNAQSELLNYSEVPASIIGNRLGTLLNTFWMAGLQYAAISQPRSTNETLIANSESNSSVYNIWEGLGYEVTRAHAYIYTDMGVYTVRWPFAIITIVISLMLIVFGFLGMYLRRINPNPDVLGYVSTLTRENPNFEPPIDAHKSDGLEMAAYYSKVKVQLVRTASGDEGGRLTLRPFRRASG